MKVAELRTHRSGMSFDLKFYEPTSTLVTDLENYLPVSLKNRLSGNAAAVKDKLAIMVGFESRPKSASENEELICFIKKFCTEFGYKYKQSVLPWATEELLFEKAKT